METKVCNDCDFEWDFDTLFPVLQSKVGGSPEVAEWSRYHFVVDIVNASDGGADLLLEAMHLVRGSAWLLVSRFDKVVTIVCTRMQSPDYLAGLLVGLGELSQRIGTEAQ